ncbi:12910_t:CDS:2 [Cetraspora pellucida]|uniref:12910_t:CDS:1 n=1 Tax=Cetraspora pellucida TaxID=1433469 RepID=A0A9N9A5P9_9GLOM|nr:12910_t:CDS:2 [Cetraspora pellucida]
MNAILLSENKNAITEAVSTVIKSTRASKAKKNAISTVKSSVNSNDKSNVISNIEIEDSATIRYTEPTFGELEAIYRNAKIQATYKATEVWVKALEKFHSNMSYEGKIEEIDTKEILKDQLSKFVYAMKKKDDSKYYSSSIYNCMAAIWQHLNQHSVMLKPVEILNPKIYFDLNIIVNDKLKNLSVKGLGKHARSDGLTLQEVKQILSHYTMQYDNPEELLQCSFVKWLNEGIDMKLYRSKTNQ